MSKGKTAAGKHEATLERLDDIALIQLVRAREPEPTIKVSLDDLSAPDEISGEGGLKAEEMRENYRVNPDSVGWVRPEAVTHQAETGAELLARILRHRDSIAGQRSHSKRTKAETDAPADDSLPQLPDGWVWARLDEIADIKGGITKDNQRNSDNCELLPYLRVANVQRGYLDLSEIKEIPVPKEHVESLLLVQGDILFNEGGDRDKLGRGWVWNGQIRRCVFQNHVFRARFHLPDSMEPKFISWYANTFGQGYFMAKGKQTTNLASINKTMLSAFPVPIAPLDQQKRIVAEIEKQFSRLDEAVANLKRVKANLKRYKAAVLRAAVEGRLVETEAERARRKTPSPLAGEGGGEGARSYETGEQLLQRILETRRSQWFIPGRGQGKSKYKEPAAPDTTDLPELPEGWGWANCGEVLSDIEAGASFKCIERPPVEDETGVLKVSAVTWGTFNELESKTCSDPDRIEEDYLVRQGDFLFSRANTIDLVGACVIVHQVSKRLMLSDKTLRFRVSSSVSEHWLLTCLRSKFGRDEIERLATGNQESMRNIGQERIRQIRVPLPPLAEQLRIVAEVSCRLSVLRETEAQVDANLQRAERLRQSILTKAFAGRPRAHSNAAIYESAL